MNLLHQRLTDSILSLHVYIGNKEVNSIKEVVRLAYLPNVEQAVREVLRNGRYDELKQFEQKIDLFGDGICVIQFSNENGKRFYGLYYDSGELWRDPINIAVFPAINKS